MEQVPYLHICTSQDLAEIFGLEQVYYYALEDANNSITCQDDSLDNMSIFEWFSDNLETFTEQEVTDVNMIGVKLSVLNSLIFLGFIKPKDKDIEDCIDELDSLGTFSSYVTKNNIGYPSYPQTIYTFTYNNGIDCIKVDSFGNTDHYRNNANTFVFDFITH